jgi:AraC-like DNA-binding protein
MLISDVHAGPRNLTSVRPHRHALWEWHFVSGGGSGFAFGRDVVRVRPGDCFLVRPGLVHGVRIAARDEWLLQYVALIEPQGRDDQALLERLWRRAGRARVLPAGLAAAPTVARLARDAEAGDPWRRRAAASRLHALLCDLAVDRAPADGEHPALGLALTLMQRRLRGSLAMRELAAATGIDASYLSRLFRRALGQPPLRHFMHLRLSAAADLLANGQPVGEAAAALGFGDQFHFSRRFRRWAGMAPSAWRGRPR